MESASLRDEDEPSHPMILHACKPLLLSATSEHRALVVVCRSQILPFRCNTVALRPGAAVPTMQ